MRPPRIRHPVPGLSVLSLAAPLIACLASSAPALAAPPTIEFQGMCDASGAVVMKGGRFVVADDEDNVLRVYDADKGGPPLLAVDVSPGLALPSKKKAPEADLEAATRLGDHALWLTSHGRNSKAKKQDSRLRFFATSVPDAAGSLALQGQPYTHLLEDLLAARGLQRFGLREAEARAPKDPGGLNIEGMTARPDGRSVVIGFRNPVPQGRALLLPVMNPLQMIQGQRAQLGPPVLVDLDGRGIRSISYWKGSYLLMGGGIADEKSPKLYRWDGRSERAEAVDGVDLTGLNPEAFATFEERPRFMVLSDDGTRLIDGQPCKKLKDPRARRFRGRWLSPR